MMNTSFIILLLALLLGIVLGYVIARFQANSEQNILRDTLNNAKEDKLKLETDLEYYQAEMISLNVQIASQKAENDGYMKRIQEQKDDILLMQSKLTIEFENIANRLFEEKSNRFTEQNKINLGNLLDPLGEKLKTFEAKVNDVYDRDNKERISLKNQIELLSKLNKEMNEETRNLTKALKGDTKTQGNWGEMILESILEKSGLTKDREYLLQVSMVEDGQRYRPDVVINLPDNKSLIIDSKVSLTAYDRFIASEINEKTSFLKEHIQSIKNHVKILANKKYQNLYGLTTLDFVLMFIPIEPAYILAVGEDYSIIDEALKQNVIIVCPSTLLATLRTVYSIWRNEKALQNSHEIAKIGGELFDRFVSFLSELEKIEKSMNQVILNYNGAITKLSGNKGIIKSVTKLGELGAKSTKIIGGRWTNEI
ncbi:MAG: DNA recombination protein RmuC [Neisseriaceae bacterium]